MLGYLSQFYPDLYREIVTSNITENNAIKWIDFYGDGDDIDARCIIEIREYFDRDCLVKIEIYINHGDGFLYPNHIVFISEYSVCDTVDVILIGEFYEDKEYYVLVNGVPYQWQLINDGPVYVSCTHEDLHP